MNPLFSLYQIRIKNGPPSRQITYIYSENEEIYQRTFTLKVLLANISNVLWQLSKLEWICDSEVT